MSAVDAPTPLPDPRTQSAEQNNARTSDPLFSQCLTADGKGDRLLFAYKGITLLSTLNASADQWSDEKGTYPRFILGQGNFDKREVHAEDLYIYAGTTFSFPGKTLIIRCRTLYIIPDGANNQVHFNCSGAVPPDAEKQDGQGNKGADAVRTMEQWPHSNAYDSAKPGGPGPNGRDAQGEGAAGGKVIFVGKVESKITGGAGFLHLTALGGDGKKGQNGGKGGKGGDGLFFTADENYKITSADGGRGGNGGRGQKAGAGGWTYFISPDVNRIACNSAAGTRGDGGIKGDPGEPGDPAKWDEWGFGGTEHKTGPSGNKGPNDNHDGDHGDTSALWGASTKEGSGTWIMRGGLTDTTHFNLILQRLYHEWQWYLHLQACDKSGVEAEDIKHAALYKIRFELFGETWQWLKDTAQHLLEPNSYPATELPVAIGGNGDPNIGAGSMALWNDMVAIWKDDKKKALRQQCLQMLDDFSRMQNAGTGPDNLRVIDVPQPNSSILNVLSSLQGIAALRQQQATMQAQMRQKKGDRKKLSLDKATYQKAQTDSQANIDALNKTQSSVADAIRASYTALQDAEVAAKDALDDLWDGRPSAIRDCKEVSNIINVVGNILLFAHGELKIPFLIGSLLQTGTAVHTAATTPADIKDSQGHVVVAGADFDAKVTALDSDLDTTSLLKGLKDSPASLGQGSGQSLKQIIAMKECFEELCDDCFSHSTAPADKIEHARELFDQLVEKATTFNENVLEYRKNVVEEQRLRNIKELSASIIAAVDDTAEQTSDLAFDRALTLCGSVLALRTGELMLDLIYMIRSWNAATLMRSSIMDPYTELGSIDAILYNQTFQTDLPLAMSRDIQTYVSTFSGHDSTPHELDAFRFTPDKDKSMFTKLKNEHESQVSFNFTKGAASRFKVDPDYYDIRLLSYKLNFEGVKKKPGVTSTTFDVRVDLGGSMFVYDKDGLEYRFAIPPAQDTVTVDIDDPTKSTTISFGKHTAFHIPRDNASGGAFDQQIRSPMTKWVFTLVKGSARDNFDWSGCSAMTLSLKISARTHTVAPVSSALPNALAVMPDAETQEAYHLYAIDIRPPTRTDSIAPASTVLDTIHALFFGKDRILQWIGKKGRSAIGYGDRTTVKIPFSAQTKAGFRKLGNDPASKADTLYKNLDGHGVNDTLTKMHQDARAHLKTLSRESDRYTIVMEGPENFGNETGHEAHVIAAHEVPEAADMVDEGSVAYDMLGGFAQGTHLLSPARFVEYNKRLSGQEKRDYINWHSKEIVKEQPVFVKGQPPPDLTGWVALLGDSCEVELKQLPTVVHADGTVSGGIVAATPEYQHFLDGANPWTWSWHNSRPNELIMSNSLFGKNKVVNFDLFNTDIAPAVLVTSHEAAVYARRARQQDIPIEKYIKDNAPHLIKPRRFWQGMDWFTPAAIGFRALWGYTLQRGQMVVHKVGWKNNEHPLDQLAGKTSDEILTGAGFPTTTEAPGWHDFIAGRHGATVICSGQYGFLDDFPLSTISKSDRDNIRKEVDQQAFENQDKTAVDSMRKMITDFIAQELKGRDLTKATPDETLRYLQEETEFNEFVATELGKMLVTGEILDAVANNVPTALADVAPGCLEKGLSSRMVERLCIAGGLVTAWSTNAIEKLAYPALERTTLAQEFDSADKALKGEEAALQSARQDLIDAKNKKDKDAIEKAEEKVAEVEERFEEADRKKASVAELKDIESDRSTREGKQGEEIARREGEVFPNNDPVAV